MTKVIPSPVRLILAFLFGILIFTNIVPALATKAPPTVNWVEGAKVIAMGDNLATLNLPKGYLFANAEDTAKLMEYMGNTASKQDIGLVVPDTEKKNWFVVFSYDPMGYVKDDESKSIDKDAILESIRTNTEEENKKRQTQGISPLIVTGWQEAPHYDPTSHNLVWAISATDDGSPVVNYNTMKLGRGGVTSINLVTSPAELTALKPQLEALVASYDYVAGNKYSDYIPGKDKIAEIGLVALIVGGGAAVAKTGIFAKIFLFLVVALKKVWIFLVVVIGGFFRKLFGGKKPQEQNSQEQNPQDQNPEK